MHRSLRLALPTAALVVALVVGPVAVTGASGVVSDARATASVPAAEPVPYIPSPNKWRQWMINVLSSVLGAATPNKWKAEQIANIYKYDGGFETLNRQFGIDGLRYNEAGQIVGVRRSSIGSGTYTDVVIAGLEDSYRGKAASGKGPLRAPATPIKTLVKVVGGAATVLFAYEMGSMIGGAGSNLLGNWLGYDSNGLVCGAEGFDSDIQKWIWRSMSGQDCSQFEALAEDYIANADVGPWVGVTLPSGATLRLVAGGVGTGGAFYCWSGPDNIGTGSLGPHAIYVKKGTTVQSANYNNLNSSHCGAAAAASDYAYTLAPPVTFYSNWVGSGSTGSGTLLGASTNHVDDVDRHLECKTDYTDGSSLTTIGPTYRESEGAAEMPACADTPAGKTPSNVTVTDKQGTSGPSQEIYDEPVTDEYQDWWEEYPECQFGACALDLIRLAPTPAVSCFDLDEGCEGWFEDPDKTENYLCRYGVHDVSLEECNVYAGIFQPGRVATGSPYADPSTGTWSGGQNAPRSADSAMTRTIQDPEAFRSCNFPNAFLDPVGAAMAGGQCLIEWAAIPRPVVAEVAFTGIEDAWATKPPGAIAEVVQNVSISGGATGCSIMTTYKGTTTPIVDACSGFMSVLATFSRLAATAMMGVLVFNQLRRQIAAMVNYNVGQG